jgi:hypothetical protein
VAQGSAILMPIFLVKLNKISKIQMKLPQGIVAFGTPCDLMASDDQQDLPMEKRTYDGAVYTNVTFHLPFICGIVSHQNVDGCLPEDISRAKEQPFFEIARNGQISGQIARFEKKQMENDSQN